MVLDLNEIFSSDVESIDIDYTLDLSDVLESGRKIFDKPIPIIGHVENRAGVVRCSYVADIVMSAVCDRCLKEFDIFSKQKFSSILLSDANDEENTEHYICDGAVLDFYDMARTDVVLWMPSKFLCSEDCEGLCSNCGAKLEDGKCSCVSDTVDPRMAKLKELLER